MGFRNREFTIFPVKFPDSREFGRRRVRSALRRQGGTRVRTRTFPFVIRQFSYFVDACIFLGIRSRGRSCKGWLAPRSSEACFAWAESRPRGTTASGAKRPLAKIVSQLARWLVGSSSRSLHCLRARLRALCVFVLVANPNTAPTRCCLNYRFCLDLQSPESAPKLTVHYDEGWRLHQPAYCGKVVSTNVGCGRSDGKNSSTAPGLLAKRRIEGWR
jgi:hypothetical protein